MDDKNVKMDLEEHDETEILKAQLATLRDKISFLETQLESIKKHNDVAQSMPQNVKTPLNKIAKDTAKRKKNRSSVWQKIDRYCGIKGFLIGILFWLVALSGAITVYFNFGVGVIIILGFPLVYSVLKSFEIEWWLEGAFKIFGTAGYWICTLLNSISISIVVAQIKGEIGILIGIFFWGIYTMIFLNAEV